MVTKLHMGAILPKIKMVKSGKLIIHGYTICIEAILTKMNIIKSDQKDILFI